MRLVRDVLNDQTSYELRLFYQSKGIIVSLSGGTKKVNDYLQICPQLDNGLPNSLFLFDSSNQIQFQQFETGFLGDLISWNAHEHVLLNHIAKNFSAKSFYDLYRQQNVADCLLVEQVK